MVDPIHNRFSFFVFFKQYRKQATSVAMFLTLDDKISIVSLSHLVRDGPGLVAVLQRTKLYQRMSSYSQHLHPRGPISACHPSLYPST